MNKRIYRVDDSESESIRLVRAGTPAQAVRHVVRTRFDVKVATQEDLVKIVGAGGQVETEGQEQANAEPQGDGSDPGI